MLRSRQYVSATTSLKKQTNTSSVDTFSKITPTNKLGLYSAIRKSSYISDALTLLMNCDVSKVRRHGSVIEVDGISFTSSQIPPIDVSSLSEIKANNNVMDFGYNNYFKYVSSDGKEHALFTNDKGIGAIFSERLRGAERDPVGLEYAKFWRYMSSNDPASMGLSFSDSEIRSYLSQAGIKNGFFTVKMGNREATQFYTESKTAFAVHSQKRYDSKYSHITSTGYELMNYEPGSVFKIGDNEYVLSENHTLDIPYGEDIYNLQDPDNYRFGEKIS